MPYEGCKCLPSWTGDFFKGWRSTSSCSKGVQNSSWHKKKKYINQTLLYVTVHVLCTYVLCTFCVHSVWPGVYLPFLWEQSFCWKSPLTLGYTRGHFSALVAMETDMDENIGAGANIDNNEDCQVVYLPLMDSEGKLLPIHFLSASEVTMAMIWGCSYSNLVSVVTNQ